MTSTSFSGARELFRAKEQHKIQVILVFQVTAMFHYATTCRFQLFISIFVTKQEKFKGPQPIHQRTSPISRMNQSQSRMKNNFYVSRIKRKNKTQKIKTKNQKSYRFNLKYFILDEGIKINKELTPLRHAIVTIKTSLLVALGRYKS